MLASCKSETPAGGIDVATSKHRLRRPRRSPGCQARQPGGGAGPIFGSAARFYPFGQRIAIPCPIALGPTRRFPHHAALCGPQRSSARRAGEHSIAPPWASSVFPIASGLAPNELAEASPRVPRQSRTPQLLAGSRLAVPGARRGRDHLRSRTTLPFQLTVCWVAWSEEVLVFLPSMFRTKRRSPISPATVVWTWISPANWS